ncbi:hypothetical protein HYPSUDRAFT_215887 [Hypholoma sublateritium FD-334 SS-4]|uniref:Uncharacterized protein n=1 Tax=Hypholoma sublateritium (strain FD-334 SS-4) TaxID=945553 RepID=A0A0D2L615_HYPSF|nr:hypothetical protein HYPSUDRAFT_215887 [Hypholoma sublateritium FD-334 SS-4]
MRSSLLSCAFTILSDRALPLRHVAPTRRSLPISQPFRDGHPSTTCITVLVSQTRCSLVGVCLYARLSASAAAILHSWFLTSIAPHPCGGENRKCLLSWVLVIFRRPLSRLSLCIRSALSLALRLPQIAFFVSDRQDGSVQVLPLTTDVHACEIFSNTIRLDFCAVFMLLPLVQLGSRPKDC